MCVYNAVLHSEPKWVRQRLACIVRYVVIPPPDLILSGADICVEGQWREWSVKVIIGVHEQLCAYMCF